MLLIRHSLGSDPSILLIRPSLLTLFLLLIRQGLGSDPSIFLTCPSLLTSPFS